MISYAKEEIDRCNQADRKIKQQNTCFLNPVLTVEEGGVPCAVIYLRVADACDAFRY